MTGSSRPPASDDLHFLAHGGEMGDRIRAHDWSRATLGRPRDWSSTLKVLVALMLNSKQPMFIAWGEERSWLYNDAFVPILGMKHPAALGEPAMEVWREAQSLLQPLFERVFHGESVSIEDFTLDLDRRGRLEEAHFEFAYTPARDPDGRVLGLFGSCIETTGRVRAERRQALAAEEQRRQFLAAPGFIAILSGPQHVLEFANTSYLALVGDRDVLGRPVAEAVPEAAGQGFVDLLDRVFASGERYVAHGTPIRLQRKRDGPLEERYLDFIYAPIFDDEGVITGIFVEGFDVTEAYVAQESLRLLNESLEERVQARTRDLEEAQSALAQAQKIEAIGQLTGGVAHDFNNLLMVILGGISMIERPGEPARRERILDGMRHAAQRGAALSRQLLAFSRRQPLQPISVDLAAQLDAMGELLDRTLRGDVHVRNEIEPDLWPVLIDPAEFELVVLNLCVNARDAMPRGGLVVIRARNARDIDCGEVKGDFVELSVSDNGTGMGPDVVARIFEPFFTTKDVGKGSGLGLPQVQGFAKQSGGDVRVESQIGQGTTVTLWLPRSLAPPVVPDRLVDVRLRKSLRHDGCVLLVEDDPEVAQLVTEMMHELGYDVVHAASADAALGALANGRGVDLMFSDIMMPGGMNGVELALEARRRRPDLPILLTSGYAEQAVTAATEHSLRVLSKPYDISSLAEAIRNVSDQGRTSDTATA